MKSKKELGEALKVVLRSKDSFEDVLQSRLELVRAGFDELECTREIFYKFYPQLNSSYCTKETLERSEKLGVREYRKELLESGDTCVAVMIIKQFIHGTISGILKKDLSRTGVSLEHYADVLANS